MDILSHGHSTTSTAGETPSDVARLRAELSEFELGRYLLNNLGLNGQWTSYVLLYPERGSQTRLSSDGSPLSDLETWLLERCPLLLATVMTSASPPLISMPRRWTLRCATTASATPPWPWRAKSGMPGNWAARDAGI